MEATREIAHEGWSEYFDALSTELVNEPVSIEILAPADPSAVEAKRLRPQTLADDHRELVREVARSHVPVQHHRVPDAQLRDGRGRADRAQRFTTRVDGVGDRDQMLIKLA